MTGVQTCALPIYDDEVGAQIGGERHGGLAIAGLAHDLEAGIREDLDDVHADEGFVFGDDNAPCSR